MAKKAPAAEKPATMKGLDLAAQIEWLEDDVGAKGCKQAQAIMDDHEVNVVKLAFKMLPKPQQGSGPKKLGARIDAILAQVPTKQREEMRETLLAAKQKASAF